LFNYNELKIQTKKPLHANEAGLVAPSEIKSNYLLEDLERLADLAA